MSTPTHPIACRIATMMRRKLTTSWSEKELKQYKKLYKAHCFDDLDDLALLERYYAFERRKGDRGCHRRDLLTLLNHFQGELDRARLWDEQHPLRLPPRKIIPLPPTPSEPLVLSAEDQAKSDAFLTEYRARKKNSFCPENEEAGAPLLNPTAVSEPRSAFQKAWKEMKG